MHVVFCHMGAENLGVEYLTAVLRKKGHRVSLLFDPALFNDKYYLNIPFLAKHFDKRAALLRKVKQLKPDIVAFTVMTDTYRWACSLAKDVKKRLPNVPIIFGGIHPTSVPDRIIGKDYVDAVCIGEGEDALAEYAADPGRTDIMNIWVKKNGVVYRNPVRPLEQDLDKLPFADKTIFHKEVSIASAYLIAANRGCPYSCTYCSNNYFNSLYKGQKIVRQRSVEHVISELRLAKKKYKMRTVYLVDDVFSANIDYVRRFMKAYNREIRIPFKIISHPSVLNEEMVRLFKSSGCYNVEIGIQSMCPETRKNLLKRYESDETIYKAVALLEKHGLRYTLHHIFGLPGDNYDKLMKAAAFYHTLKYCTKIDCYWLSYFPRTEIVDISKRMGLLSPERVEQIEEGAEAMYFEGGSVKGKDLRQLCKDFDIFFQLIPTIPMWLRKLIFRRRLFLYFHHLPDQSIILANLVNAVKNRDSRTFDYIGYYLKHIG